MSAAAPPLQALNQGLRPDEGSMPSRPETAHQLASPQAPAAPAAAESADANAVPAVTDVLALLRNAGMQNPLAGLQATLGSLAAPNVASTANGNVDNAQAADNGGANADSGTADVQDAGPVLAGDDGGGNATDVSNNIMALLGQLASTQ